ncbi:MAG: N-acetyltransferase family protein, partial [Myxococcota bacterium]
MNPVPVIRTAEQVDLSAIVEIYNYEITHGTSTFDTQPVTLDERRVWLAAHDSPRYPVVVADWPDSHSRTEVGHRGDTWPNVAGWASLSPWSQRCAYARAAEVSVYVDRRARGLGIGRALLGELVARGRDAGLGVLLARICAEGAVSLALHRALGFEHIGTMRRVGEKFGRILD